MTVKVEKKDKVTIIIINRPQVKNAVNSQTAKALADAFRAFEADDEAGVAVLCGEGGTFCAGADLKEVASGKRERSDKMTDDGPMGPTRMTLSKPVIAAVSGYAVAGGLELALWCDLRVVEKTAVFGVFSRRFGVPYIDGGTIRLPRLIGLSRALDMFLTGRPVHAEEAFTMGLANRVVAEGQARAEAEKLAAEIAAFPAIAMQNDRLSAYEQFSMSMEDALANEYKRGMRSLESPEAREGATRFASGEGRGGEF